jgi:hypothetical protein
MVMMQLGDVRDLVFLENKTRLDGSVFDEWSMDIEFGVFRDSNKQKYWYKDTPYIALEELRDYDDKMGKQIYTSPEVHISLSHNVVKVNKDKQFVCYAVLENEEAVAVTSQPKPMYCFTESAILYKRCRLPRDEIYTFQFDAKEYTLDVNGNVEEVQAKESIKVMQVEEPALVEEEEKTSSCFPSFRGFFRRNKGSASSSSSSSSESNLEGYSSSRSSSSRSSSSRTSPNLSR